MSLEMSLFLLFSFSVFGVAIQSAHITKLLESTTDEVPCHTDTECPETSFCFHVSHVCTSCFNCASQFRQTIVKCARKVQDCGDCLPGYTEQTYSRFLIDRRWCKEVVKMIAEPQKMDDSSLVSFNPQWVGVLIICCVSFLGFASFYYYRSSKRQHDISVSDSLSMNELNTNYNCITTHMSAPPPYKEDSDADDDVSCSFQLRIVEHSVNDKQKAVPYFVYDNSVSDCENTDNNGQNGTPSTGNHGGIVESAANTAPTVEIQDESTLPSSWTPGESYGDNCAENQLQGGDEKISPPNKRKRFEEPSRKKHRGSK